MQAKRPAETPTPNVGNIKIHLPETKQVTIRKAFLSNLLIANWARSFGPIFQTHFNFLFLLYSDRDNFICVFALNTRPVLKAILNRDPDFRSQNQQTLAIKLSQRM